MFIAAMIMLLCLPRSYSQVPQTFGNFPITYDTTNVLSNPYWAEGLPIVADFKGDGGKEIAVGTHTASIGHPRMFLIDLNGNTLPGWPRIFRDTLYPYSVLISAAGDINSNGKIDLVVKTSDSIYAMDFNGNNLLGFPIYLPQSDPTYGAMALCDLENNGQLNIIACGDNKIVVYNSNGSIKNGWPRLLSIGYDFYQLSICDIDGDGKAEIIASSLCGIGAGCDSNLIHVFDRNGNYLPGWPVHSDSMYNVGISAVVLRKDSLLASNSSLYVCTNIVTQPPVHSRITEYDTHGNIRIRWYLYDDYLFTPIVADFKRDGQLELFTGEQSYNVFLYTLAGSLISGWPQHGSDAFQWQSCVGKITYNNELYALSPTQQAFIDSQNVPRGRLYAYDYNGNIANGWPLKPLYLIMGTTCYDVNNDGSVEILTTGASGTSSALSIYTIPGIPFTNENFPWPMFAHDRYRTNQLDFVPPDEPIGIKPISQNIPGRFKLYQNYPNPFNPSTTIKFDVPVKSSVRLEIYDVTGRKIMHSDYASLQPGSYKIDWSAEKYASGIYFYRIFGTNFSIQFVDVKKMVLLK